MQEPDFEKALIIVDNEKEQAKVADYIKELSLEDKAAVYIFDKELVKKIQSERHTPRAVCFTSNAETSTFTADKGIHILTYTYVPQDAQDAMVLRKELLTKGLSNRFFMEQGQAFSDILAEEILNVDAIISLAKNSTQHFVREGTQIIDLNSVKRTKTGDRLTVQELITIRNAEKTPEKANL